MGNKKTNTSSGKSWSKWSLAYRWRSLLLVTTLCGSVIFMFYKASLTSALAVRSHKYPFEDLEEMVESDYR